MGSAGCAPAFPAFSTPVRSTTADSATLDPPPPNHLVYLRLGSAKIPKRTRDGRAWDEVGGKAPDPYAIVFLDNRELFRTQPQPNTLVPDWSDGPSGNYRIGPRAELRIEIYDKNAMQPRPICMVELTGVEEAADEGGREVQCDSGASVRLLVEPAHAVIGVGLSLEVHAAEVLVTRVEEESPADRAGCARGDRIIAINGKAVRQMVEGEVRSVIRASVRTGFSLTLLEPDGATRTVSLKDGPIYLVSSSVPGSD
ncbi:MAG: PDZ domain-containing protein [Polyangiaceae bacterium]|nr:PDZ domain-containing protein [Polyangiaceae bacterium]